ncbi:hypothetical protein PR048_023247 [Dryococelus australis]|uniref:Uncharacterized protein n=1 Tax=Dryococelus australis TaxID=614101 RepID=A0ABQ9GTK5_9NEOP|nr:hypothetical protein PR048_023247 [Dryococelus australis]
MPQYTIQERALCLEQYIRSYGTERSGKNGGPFLVSLMTEFQGQFQRPAPPKPKPNHSLVGRKVPESITRCNGSDGRVMDKVKRSPKKSFRLMSEELLLETTAV